MSGTMSYFGVPTGVGEGRGGILQPKQKWKYRVIATNFGIPSGSIALTQQVKTVSRPSVSFEPVEVHSYNSIDYFAGKPKWETLSLVVRDDVTNSVASLVGAQVQKQMNFFQQTTPLSGSSYKFQLLIDTLDGSDDGVLEEWFVEGCFLSDAKYGGFDSSSSEAMEIELTVRFANATQTGGLMPITPIYSTDTGFTS